MWGVTIVSFETVQRSPLTSVLGEEAPENTTFALVWKQM